MNGTRRSAPLFATVALCLSLASALRAQVSRVGGEFQANTYTPGDQYGPKVGLSTNGSFVVVWTGPVGAPRGVFARRFATDGAPLGTEFQVSAYTLYQQSAPGVAVDGEGDFVVVWTRSSLEAVIDGIFARRFDSSGSPQATEFRVSMFTQNGTLASIAMKSDGAFVIALRENDRDGSLGGIFTRRFDSAGAAQGGEVLVNAYTSDEQHDPSIAIAGDGSFVVTWTDDSGLDGLGRGVFARRFNSSGTPTGSQFQVSTYTIFGQQASRVAMSSGGDFVIAWQSVNNGEDLYGVFARRFNAAGMASGPEFRVNTFTNQFQTAPEVTLSDDGAFVIVWYTDTLDGSGKGVFGRRFDAAGVPEPGREFQVSSFTVGNQNFPAIGGDSSGDFVVAWHSDGQDAGGVFAQRFSVPKAFDIDGNGVVDAVTDGVLFLRYTFGFRGSTLVNGAVALDCSRCTAAPIEGQIAGLAVTNAAAAGPEFKVNSYTPGNQDIPDAAATGNGDFVLVWQSGHDGSQKGVFARVFDRGGGPQTAELQVNDYVTDQQTYPVVGMADDGRFVVAWQSIQDGSDYGIFARRFDSSGLAQAAELQVNTYTTGDQTQPAIAVRDSGEFVVVWLSAGQDGDVEGVFGRRFDAAGVAQATEFQVNGRTTNYQTGATVAMASSGAFVVAWESFFTAASGTEILARRFDAAGIAQSSELQVNHYTTNYQRKADVAIGSAGDFVVTWTSAGQDGPSNGIFARRFDSLGAPLGAELQVNAYTVSDQYGPAIARETDGRFVVTWSSYLQDGQNTGVFARRFDSAGAPLATELQVNTRAESFQSTSTVAVDPGGNFVIAWRSNGQDGSGYGVFAQRFAASRASDIDGDGVIGPLTDGLLVLRYLFGLRGAALIHGAVGANCTRCTAPAIESWIASKV